MEEGAKMRIQELRTQEEEDDAALALRTTRLLMFKAKYLSMRTSQLNWDMELSP
jgi:hypothetical protein